jgi:hypothetical protein
MVRVRKAVKNGLIASFMGYLTQNNWFNDLSLLLIKE